MKYLSYIFLTILSLVFVSCGDDDGLPEPDGGNSLGTGQVNFDFIGESYEVNGLGYVSVVDTFINFAIEDSTGTLNYDTLYNQAISFGVIDYQDDSFTPRKVFGALIVNYDGPGTYPYFGFNGNVEDSGLWWIFIRNILMMGLPLKKLSMGGSVYCIQTTKIIVVQLSLPRTTITCWKALFRLMPTAIWESPKL